MNMAHPHTLEHPVTAKVGDAVLPIPDVVGGKSFLWHDTLMAHGWNELKAEEKILRATTVAKDGLGGVTGVICPALPKAGELDVYPDEVKLA